MVHVLIDIARIKGEQNVRMMSANHADDVAAQFVFGNHIHPTILVPHPLEHIDI